MMAGECLLRRISRAALVALLFCAGFGSGRAGAAVPGQAAPLFDLPRSDGGSVSLQRLRGSAVYLNFFASWCPPCNAEAPDISSLAARYRSRGLRVVGIDELESKAKAQEFKTRYKLTYPVVLDAGDARNKYLVNGLPVHVFIDRRGRIKVYREGEMSGAEIEAAIKSIL